MFYLEGFGKILGHENNNKEKEKNFQTTNYSYFLKE